jgi:hypothetical protein
MPMICTTCSDTRWVCEVHTDRPWGDIDGTCTCGAAGMPCLRCNSSDGLEPPEMPPGFIEDNGTRR